MARLERPWPPPNRRSRPGQDAAFLSDNSSDDDATGSRSTTRRPQAGGNADAAIGAAERPRRRLELIDFRPLIKGGLRGFCRVRLPSGLIISDVMVFPSRGRNWASFSSKPVLDEDGRHKPGADGKPANAPMIAWESDELRKGFSKALVALVLEKYPNALDGGGS